MGPDKHWRLLDPGPKSAAENMALDLVLLEARSRGLAWNTLRFLQFRRPAVLVGYHQDLHQEVRLDFCAENGIEVNRRVTGGGTVLFEPGHIGWEIIAHRSDPNFCLPPHRIVERICRIFCRALRDAFGVAASFRPRNDIEVHGRKISGTGGTQEGDAFLFQGTLLVDLDVGRMLRALRVPMEKLKAHEIDSLFERVTSLRREMTRIPAAHTIKEAIVRAFAEAFAVHPRPLGLSGWESARLASLRETFAGRSWIDRRSATRQNRAFLRSIHRGRGGVIRVTLDADAARSRIRSVLFSGDFFAYPNRAVHDLESRFKDVPASPEAVRTILEDFFRSGSPFSSLDGDDFDRALQKALGKLSYLQLGFSHSDTDCLFPVQDDVQKVLEKPWRWFLLPYCSKDLSCELRHLDGCWECGKCSIGEGYALAKEHDLRPITITSFEDLRDRLSEIRRAGSEGFLGCCCEGFYVKHAGDFERAGVPGLLVTMDSTTCYDLGKARDAYRGQFENQTELNLPLLKKVLDLRRAHR